jgi:hypothetical protein
MKVTDYYWDEEDFIIETENEEKFRLRKAYLASCSFGELETSESDIVEIESRYDYES